jgi:hydroxymethylpyrimidine pyrophosphatase-like HAD family hydrolase
MDNKKILAFDLDDTICFRPNEFEHLGTSKYIHCQPIPEMVELVNEMYDKGHTIYIYTARGMMTLKGDLKKIHETLYDLTLNHLKEWGVKHHGLFMGKIHYDLLIDDKVVELKNAKEVLKNL